jgi:glucose repression mediator protein
MYPISALIDFEKANEIYFRLGIIYKQQHKYPASLDCFRYILGHPPRPLTEVDIWFQIGHVYEQQKDVSLRRIYPTILPHVGSPCFPLVQYGAAKDAYERVLKDSPNHAKVLQQLGWLYHQGGASFANQDLAISYLTKSLEAGE